MKYIILLGDGMSDEPIEELDGKTPLQAANTPNMDKLAQQGVTGLAATVPREFHPGSDVANLSVFGYDPATCYTGRSPLEAASMGVELGPDDVAFRLNLVTLGLAGGDVLMQDFSAGHITTEEARELIECLQDDLGDDDIEADIDGEIEDSQERGHARAPRGLVASMVSSRPGASDQGPTKARPMVMLAA